MYVTQLTWEKLGLAVTTTSGFTLSQPIACIQFNTQLHCSIDAASWQPEYFEVILCMFDFLEYQDISTNPVHTSDADDVDYSPGHSQSADLHQMANGIAPRLAGLSQNGKIRSVFLLSFQVRFSWQFTTLSVIYMLRTYLVSMMKLSMHALKKLTSFSALSSGHASNMSGPDDHSRGIFWNWNELHFEKAHYTKLSAVKVYVPMFGVRNNVVTMEEYRCRAKVKLLLECLVWKTQPKKLEHYLWSSLMNIILRC
jgi:hypothetical protein